MARNILIVAILVVCGAIIGCGSENSSNNTESSQPVQPQPIGNPFLPIKPVVPPCHKHECDKHSNH